MIDIINNLKKITKIILAIVVLYVFIGIVFAARWSMNYDPNNNSAPNDAIIFIINTLTWSF